MSGRSGYPRGTGLRPTGWNPETEAFEFDAATVFTAQLFRYATIAALLVAAVASLREWFL